MIPRPFDLRLIVRIAPAAAKAAMESAAVATVQFKIGMCLSVEKLTQFVYKTSLFMRPIAN